MNVTIDADFDAAAAPFRRELVVHCYRMLGSVDEAEDLAQETLIRAWKARDRYDAERASLRTWLYRIATNACLTALQSRPRRPLPSGLGAASETRTRRSFRTSRCRGCSPCRRPTCVATRLIRWPARPSATASGSRWSPRCSLPPRQRAVLVLRDVLPFSAAEVAGQLETSTAAVNSALQRARARSPRPRPGEHAAQARRPGGAARRSSATSRRSRPPTSTRWSRC